MQEALSLVKQQLGEDAVILSSQKVNGANGAESFEITAAVDNIPGPSATDEPEAPRADFVTGIQPPEEVDALADVLHKHGVASELVGKITKAAEALHDSGFSAADTLDMVLGKMVPFASPAETLARGKAHVFVGPTGAGKTTTVAKLAAAMRLQGASVGLISLDYQKIGGFAPLDIIADILEDQAHLVSNRQEFIDAAKALGKRNYVFIDTAGFSPYAEEAIDNLKTLLDEIGLEHTVHLILPATMNPFEMPTIPLATQKLKPASLLFTKMDETSYLGGMLNTAAGSGLKVCYMADGPDIMRDIATLDAASLAQLLAHPPRLPWE